jgi:hypothetical protein
VFLASAAHRIAETNSPVQGTSTPTSSKAPPSKPSQTIKSHYNVGGLPETMELKLIEFVRELFKDDVRHIGRDLHMPEEILERQPFTGPASPSASSARSPPNAPPSSRRQTTPSHRDQGRWPLPRDLAALRWSASWVTSGHTPTPASSATCIRKAA